MSVIVSSILLIHVYIFVSCALLDVDVASVQKVASVQRRMPHGNGQVNWVLYVKPSCYALRYVSYLISLVY